MTSFLFHASAYKWIKADCFSIGFWNTYFRFSTTLNCHRFLLLHVFLFRAPLLWFLCSSFHSLRSIKQNISFTKLNISFTELISPSVNYILEGKMTLSTKYLLHQFLLYTYLVWTTVWRLALGKFPHGRRMSPRHWDWEPSWEADYQDDQTRWTDH